MTDAAEQGSAHSYQLDQLLGSGAFGEVWSAKKKDKRGVTVSSEVAIKILIPTRGQTATHLLEAAGREFKILSKLSHPNIVKLWELQERIEHHTHGPCPAIVMAHIEGQTLRDFTRRNRKVRGGRVGLLETLYVVHSVAKALRYAHNKTSEGADHGILHRDISMRNIMIASNGNVMLTDFGIAHFVKDYVQGVVVTGTPPYAAPEIWRPHQPARPESDVYSLGVVLHELMTGTSYMRGLDNSERIKITTALQAPPSLDRDEHESWLVDLHDAMLQPLDPGLRPTAGEVAKIIRGNCRDVIDGSAALEEHYRVLFASPEDSVLPPTASVSSSSVSGSPSSASSALQPAPPLSELLDTPLLEAVVGEATQELERAWNDGTVQVSPYIEALARAPKDRVGVSVCFTDGAAPIHAGHHGGIARNERRDGDLPWGAAPADWAEDEANNGFTIQSISKVFALLFVLERVSDGHRRVSRLVGWEPTGKRFGEYATVELDGRHRPANPLVNAGALCVTSLIYDHAGEDAPRVLMDFVRELCGDAEGAIVIDYEAWEQEQGAAHVNHMLAWTLLRNEVLKPQLRSSSPADRSLEQREWVDGVLDAYFGQCSIVATCDHLAHAAAVLANGGFVPGTTRQLIRPEHVGLILPLMATCGLYDGTGEFLCSTGLPAKSGIGGGIMCVAPGRAGIATWSPLLDRVGNSKIGKWILKQIADPRGRDEATNQRRLHLFDQSPRPRIAASPVQSSADLQRLCDDIKSRHDKDGPGLFPRPAITRQDRQFTHRLAASICRLGSDELEFIDSDPDTRVVEHRFSIQAIVNVFALLYALVLDHNDVWKVVGKEPSGDPYDMISWLEIEGPDKRLVPANPMINAGALIVTSLITRPSEDASGDGPLDLSDFVQFCASVCGLPVSEVQLDEAAARVELEHPYSRKNRVVAWELASQGRFDDFFATHRVAGSARHALIDRFVEAYVRACHMRLSCRDLARFAALLANHGQDPVTGIQRVNARIVREVLVLMLSSGMYDGSGELAQTAGIPCKGGMSGGIIAVAPGRAGIAAFSPRVNKRRNSYWGRHLIEAISQLEGLSVFRG